MKPFIAVTNIISLSLALFGLAAPFSALALSITLNPISGPAGSQTTISGLDTTLSYTVYLDGTQISSGFSGTPSITITIPSTASAGSHTVSVSQGAESSSATFTVTGGTFQYQTLPNILNTKEDLLSKLDTIVNWIFTGFVILSIIFVILAGLQFITGGGEPVKVEEARKKLIWAVIGIIVALIAKGFPLVIRNILGA